MSSNHLIPIIALCHHQRIQQTQLLDGCRQLGDPRRVNRGAITLPRRINQIQFKFLSHFNARPYSKSTGDNQCH